MQSSHEQTPEFDQYAPAYAKLLDDPLRNRFARDPLHFHRRKWQLIQSLLQRAGTAPKAFRWLDVGCGQGELLSLAGSAFASAAGCDPSPGMLAPQAAYETRVQSSLTELPFATASVDFVTAVCVYHHVHGHHVHGPARKLLTDEVKRVLAPGGLCCIIEHNPWNPVTQRIVRRCPVDVDAELLSAREARRILAGSGLKTLTTSYFLYLPESLYQRFGLVETLLAKVPIGGQYAVLARA
jgi:SAM-dependent methyltransferase